MSEFKKVYCRDCLEYYHGTNTAAGDTWTSCFPSCRHCPTKKNKYTGELIFLKKPDNSKGNCKYYKSKKRYNHLKEVMFKKKKSCWEKFL